MSIVNLAKAPDRIRNVAKEVRRQTSSNPFTWDTLHDPQWDWPRPLTPKAIHELNCYLKEKSDEQVLTIEL